MKKVFLFAVAAAALVACSNEELSTPENSLVNSKEAPVNEGTEKVLKTGRLLDY